MAKYLIKRILYSLLSVIVVTFIIMLLIFQLKSRESIFVNDATLTHLGNNEKEVYKAGKLQEYGYLEYVPYRDWVDKQVEKDGVTDANLIAFYKKLPTASSQVTSNYTGSYTTTDADGNTVQHTGVKNPYLYRFRQEMEAAGYTVSFLNARTGTSQQYYATRDLNIFVRLGNFLGGIFSFENIGDVISENLTDRYMRWEWDDYSNAPALVGSGTQNKYLIYYDNEGSIITNQNWFHINLGTSYTGDDKGRTIESILLDAQGSSVFRTVPYPKQYELIESTYGVTGIDFTLEYYSGNGTADTSDDVRVPEKDIKVSSNKVDILFDNIYDSVRVVDKDGNALTGCFTDRYGNACDSYGPSANAGMALQLSVPYAMYFNAEKPVTVVIPTAVDYHSATFSDLDDASFEERYGTQFYDRYVITSTKKQGLSTMGYSFLIGILATLLSYLLGIPFGIWMARKKDKFVDHLGMVYIIFIIAVPSLAYIAIFRALGSAMSLPSKFVIGGGWTYFVLPVVSLALPSIGSLMKWIRRYMIDQENSDYVKFARSQGLSEGEIFTKHIARNAAIPLIQGIPGSILGCLTGAFITERFYSVPGTGRLLTTAINISDNGEIVALAFFYSVLSIISLIAGDILITMIDPRISFVEKGSSSGKKFRWPFRKKKAALAAVGERQEGGPEASEDGKETPGEERKED